MDNITIGYLSWKRYNIFNQTLESHLLNGLHDIIKPENRYIYFQEITEQDINISNKYNCKYLGNNNNVGILNAFIELVNNCNTEYFIFSENDWYLNENKQITKQIIDDCIKLLSNNLCDIIRLRHRTKPGNPLYAKPKNYNDWIKNNLNNFPYKLASLSWIEEDPNKIYNNLFTTFTNNFKWYITTLKHQKWSNNIFISKTSFLKDTILPIIKDFKNNNNNYSGLELILSRCNKINDIKISAGEGLFTHKDYI
jgi:hypothetical protein